MVTIESGGAPRLAGPSGLRTPAGTGGVAPASSRAEVAPRPPTVPGDQAVNRKCEDGASFVFGHNRQARKNGNGFRFPRNKAGCILCPVGRGPAFPLFSGEFPVYYPFRSGFCPA